MRDLQITVSLRDEEVEAFALDAGIATEHVTSVELAAFSIVAVHRAFASISKKKAGPGKTYGSFVRCELTEDDRLSIHAAHGDGSKASAIWIERDSGEAVIEYPFEKEVESRLRGYSQYFRAHTHGVPALHGRLKDAIHDLSRFNSSRILVSTRRLS